MTDKVNPIPENYRSATPYLNVKDGTRAIEFYKQAFDASEVIRIPRRDGKLGHAEVRIGEALIMIRDEIPEMNFLSPQSIGGTPVQILIYVNDVDALLKQAEAAGAKVDLTRFDGHPDNARYYDRAGRCSWQNQKENLLLSSS